MPLSSQKKAVCNYVFTKPVKLEAESNQNLDNAKKVVAFEIKGHRESVSPKTNKTSSSKPSSRQKVQLQP
jgi:hypothetical protein